MTLHFRRKRQVDQSKLQHTCLSTHLLNFFFDSAKCNKFYFLKTWYSNNHYNTSPYKPSRICFQSVKLIVVGLLFTVVYLVCIYVTSCVLFYYVCIAVLHTLVAGLLARSQYPEGPANGHLDTGFSWFPCV